MSANHSFTPRYGLAEVTRPRIGLPHDAFPVSERLKSTKCSFPTENNPKPTGKLGLLPAAQSVGDLGGFQAAARPQGFHPPGTQPIDEKGTAQASDAGDFHV